MALLGSTQRGGEGDKTCPPDGYEVFSVAQKNGITAEQARYLLRRMAAQKS